jgi:hypothetical protein
MQSLSVQLLPKKDALGASYTPGYICGTCDYNKICPARGE